MAPGYRNQNRRQNRTGVDHDVFEGLPVRHWRRDYVTVAPPPTQENNASQNDIWAVELPHGMPKDYHLLPQHSQDLLRAARSGRIYKRPAPVEEDEVDAEGILGDKPEKKEEDPKDKGFSAKAWKQVPRHLEGPDVEYLAKRRKGIITAGSKTAPTIPAMTKATVKRIDATGNEYIQDVVVPRGQQVEGELISRTEISGPSTVGVDGPAVHPTPPKRKPIIRKKAKGPGRGRKKKPVAPTSAPANQLDGTGKPIGEGAAGPVRSDGVKIESDGATQPPQSEDTEMADGSIVASDNDDSDEGEDGEEGDEDEGSIDNQASPSKRQESSSLSPIPSMEEIPRLAPEDTSMSGVEIPPHPVINTDMEGKSGSPLKNVAMATSALASPVEAPPISAPVLAEKAPDVPAQVAAIEEVMQEETAETAPPTLPPPPPEPTLAEVEAAVEERHAEEEEEVMLLDIVEENSAHYTEPEVPDIPDIPPPQELTEIVSTVSEPEPVPLDAPLQDVQSQPEEPTNTEAPEPLEPQAEAVQHGEMEDFPDLLGDLEKSLEKPVAAAPPVEAAPEVVEQSTLIEKPAEAEAETVAPSENEVADVPSEEGKEV